MSRRLLARALEAGSRRLAADHRPAQVLSAPRLRPEDVFLASYPRSGNTWLRAIVAYILYDPSRITSLADLNRLVPDIHGRIPNRVDYSDPRVIKTHLPFPNRHESHRPDLYRRVIYCARHPVDAIRSYYHYQAGLGYIDPAETTFADFVDRVLNYSDPFGSWQQHVLSWWTAARDHEVLFVRYEDLLAEPATEVRKVARFLGRDLADAAVDLVLEHTSREAMVRLEEAGSLVHRSYRFIAPKSRRTDAPEVTLGIRDGIVERCKEAMAHLGYDREAARR